jgi:hypothetical protein
LTNPGDGLAGESRPLSAPEARGRSRRLEAAGGLAAAALIAAVLASLDGSQNWLGGWAAYAAMGGLGFLLVWGAMHAAAAPAALPAALAALLLRLGIGVVLFLIFPAAGYPDNPATQAGYLYSDAHVRDQQAWQLARSGDPLSAAFANQYTGDQYGGLMALSAGLYRYLSPDAHRPLLVVLAAAASAAAGVFFVWKAAQGWFGAAVGSAAAWIFALYPESVLLGSSQMREAFVLTGVALTVYSLSRMGEKTARWAAWMGLGVIVLLLFQPLAALFAFVVLTGAWLLEPSRRRSWKHAVLFGGIILMAGLAVISVFAALPSLQEANPSNVLFIWLSNNFTFKSGQTQTGSGIFQHLVRTMGEWSRLPVVLVYGIAQPVLPAALGDKASVPLIWRVINIFRAVGWYALAPFLVYGFFGALRAAGYPRRWQLAWIGGIIWVWIGIASLNAGGNLWDNPRYRIVLLAWMAVLAAWAWQWARQHQDRWLKRFLGVEAVFVGVFTIWYLGRNYAQFLHIGIFQAILLTVLLSAAVLGWGLFQDRRSRL